MDVHCSKYCLFCENMTLQRHRSKSFFGIQHFPTLMFVLRHILWLDNMCKWIGSTDNLQCNENCLNLTINFQYIFMCISKCFITSSYHRPSWGCCELFASELLVSERPIELFLILEWTQILTPKLQQKLLFSFDLALRKAFD